MRGSTLVTAIGALIGLVILPSAPVRGADSIDPGEFLGRYCVDCHRGDEPSGHVDLEALSQRTSSSTSSPDKANPLQVELLQEVVDQLTLETMPPDDAEQPSPELRRAAINQLKALRSELGRKFLPQPPGTTLRRLSRREYRRTIGDLLAIDMTMFDPTLEFPADTLTLALDNDAATLVTSAQLVEQYLDAADRCLEKALEVDRPPASQHWRFTSDFYQQPELQTAHRAAFDHRYLVLYDHPLNDKPEGAYGPLTEFKTGVPVTGIYRIRVRAEALHRDTPYNDQAVMIYRDEPFRLGIRPGDTRIGDMVHRQPIEPLLAETNVADNELKWYEFEIPLDRGFAPRFTFENGQHDVRGAYSRVFRFHKDLLPEHVRNGTGIVAFRNATIKHGSLPQIRIHEVEIQGPLASEWPTASRRRLLNAAELDPDQVPSLLERFASRAYRRTATDEEVQRLIGLYQQQLGAGQSPFEAYKDAIKAALCSPGFLYFNPQRTPAGELTTHALAERLSYFLTSTMPDDQLRALADATPSSGTPDWLAAETRRLIAAPGSEGFVADFLDGWLRLRSLGSMPPDEKASRVYYSAGLEPEMKRETQLFLRDLLNRNASVLECLRADYSFVNRDLARLYGVESQVPADRAAEFHRVTFDNPRRGGLLGQASVLTVSANGIESSPVVRGIWLLENVLGSSVPPPPTAVPAIEPDVRGVTTIRELLVQHRSAAECNVCHRKIDPLGFALECFDPIGRERKFYDRDRRQLIDTSGQLPGSHQFSDLAELKSLLLKKDTVFVRAFLERLASHALGRAMTAGDRIVLDEIIDSLQPRDYPVVDLICALTTSELFRR